jgi:hypothetical protein
MSWAAARLGVLLAVSGCAASVRPPLSNPPDSERAACLLTDTPTTADTVTVGATGTIELRDAPVPRTPAEQVVFRYLYDTVIRVDCRGRVQPALAESWTSAADGRAWVFRLRSDARFWDGAPVTARDVVASWRRADGESPVVSVIATDDGGLTLTLDHPYPTVPRFLADPTWAVARTDTTANGWPVGTGGYLVIASTPGDVVAVPYGALGRDEMPVLHFVTTAGDARDLVDAGSDLLVSADPMVVRYAETRDSLDVVALDWDRVYAVATPEGVRSFPDPTDDSLAAIVGIVASAGAVRPAAPPEWWQQAPDCELPALTLPEGDTAAHRLVYAAADAVSRAYAERLVALASARALRPITTAPQELVAAGLAPTAFAAALRAGRDRAYVVSLPRHVLDRCAASVALVRRIPWAAPAVGSALIPLVETRRYAILGPRVGTVAIDWDGAPYLTLAEPR